MNSDFQKHIKFFKLENALKSKFGPNALLEIDSDLYSEILKYSVELSDYLHWNNRQYYFHLMNDFVNFSITGLQFEKGFYSKFREVESLVADFKKNPEKLKTISFDPNSKNFSRWISEISEDCNAFDSDFDPNDVVYPFTNDEAGLRKAVKGILPEIEKYLES